MQPVSVCQKVSWNCSPNASLRPDHRLGVERLADARQVAQRGEVELLRHLRALAHQQPDRGRGRVPDGDAVLLDEGVPALGAEPRVEHRLGDAVGPRPDDPVGRAGHPAGVGVAPVDVVGLQVEHPLGRQVLGDERVVHVLRALGLPGGARGVVQHRGGLGGGRVDVELLHLGRLVQVERDLPFLERRLRGVHDDDVLEVGQLVLDLADLQNVLLLRDDGGGLRVVEARPQRLVAERREQRLGDRPHLEDADEADVQLRHPVHEQADPLPGLDPERLQEGRDGVGAAAQVVVGVLLLVPLGVLPEQRVLVALARACRCGPSSTTRC